MAQTYMQAQTVTHSAPPQVSYLPPVVSSEPQMAQSYLQAQTVTHAAPTVYEQTPPVIYSAPPMYEQAPPMTHTAPAVQFESATAMPVATPAPATTYAMPGTTM